MNSIPRLASLFSLAFRKSPETKLKIEKKNTAANVKPTATVSKSINPFAPTQSTQSSTTTTQLTGPKSMINPFAKKD